MTGRRPLATGCRGNRLFMLDDITPMILTLNEAPNIGRTLERLRWAREILVVDSYSTDETLEIVRRHPQARIVQRPFDTFARQCNFGLDQVRTSWVLSLDADYVLSDELVAELGGLQPAPDAAGFRAAFRYCVFGRPLRASLYPPRTVLYRVARGRYREDGHAHRVQVEGQVVPLRGRIDHDDRKPFDRWLHEQRRYMDQEAQAILAASPGELGWADRLRRSMTVAPLAVLLYTLIGRGLILDGWPGVYYAAQRTYTEWLLLLELLDRRLRG
jgi:glycosyltransferase involved in cell wall biosynthesis